MLLYLRSLLWTILFPGTVTIFFPRLILSSAAPRNPAWNVCEWAGILLILAGGAVLLWCIYAFARDGKGTLSPADPARRLVVRGMYRYVRNPMYVGVVAILLGESLFFRSTSLLGYAAVIFTGFNLFIRLHEEPYLRRQFGADYERYCAQVGRWLPGRAFVLWLFPAFLVSSCSSTFYLVRHAERLDASRDSPLSTAGFARAETLRDTLLGKSIDSIFTSTFLRTRQTAQPLADALLENVRLYSPDTTAGLITALKKIGGGKQVLVVGHSNTIPRVVEGLCGQTVSIAEDDFDNLFIVKISKAWGRTKTTLVKTTYGQPSP